MITKMAFGATGQISTRTLFGAAALGGVSQADADKTFELLFKYGINHIDTAASYGDAELRIGPWMVDHRNEFFLATKTGQRPYQEAHDEIRRSLERMRTDHVDLLQLHALFEPDEWDVAMGDNGALKAAIEAKEEGLTRFIGVTGHGVTVARMHIKSLERYPFDSVLLPYNYTMLQNAEYHADLEELIALCQQRSVAVQTIKSLAVGAWGDKARTRSTWYEPLEAQEDIDLAVNYVLGDPRIFLNTSGDINILPRILDAASRFTARPSDEQMQALVERRGMTPLFPRSA
jgi:aryl-alcohol dehydrogenase-like predicted oxidoreductase